MKTDRTAGRGRCRRVRNSRGASTVEFALVAPLIFLFVFGVLELGRVILIQQTLAHATREGARLAALPNTTESDVIAEVASVAARGSVPGVNVQVAPNPTGATIGDPIVVTATVSYDNVSWVPSSWFLQNPTLVSSTSMRKEGLE